MTRKKTWAKKGHVEVWKRKGQPQPKRRVYRNVFGRFVSHHYIRPYNKGATAKRKWTYREMTPTGKSLAVFGRTRQGSKRWELHKGLATGIEWRNAVGLAREHPPRQHLRRINVRDMDFDEFEGEWIEEPEVRS